MFEQNDKGENRRKPKIYQLINTSTLCTEPAGSGRERDLSTTHPRWTTVVALSGSSSKAFVNIFSASSNLPRSHSDWKNTKQNSWCHMRSLLLQATVRMQATAKKFTQEREELFAQIRLSPLTHHAGPSLAECAVIFPSSEWFARFTCLASNCYYAVVLFCIICRDMMQRTRMG